MSMRVDLHAKVHTQDGHDAGHVERVILDPGGAWVREYVIDTGGLLGRQVLVPSAEIEAAERKDGRLHLRLSKKDLEALPTYVAEQYVYPPVGWIPPAGLASLGLPEAAYVWPAALAGTMPVAPASTAPVTNMPGTPARSTRVTGSTVPATDGTNSIGTAARDGEVRPDGIDYDAEIGISRDAVVLDKDGDDVGVVDEVRINERDGAVQGFVLRVGGVLRTLFGGGEHVEVTRSQIDRVSEGVVQLRLTKDELHRLGAAGKARK